MEESAFSTRQLMAAAARILCAFIACVIEPITQKQGA